MSAQALVCVMAKAPVAGQVKTRLVPPLSAEEAASLAAAFLVDTWASAAAVRGASPVLAIAGDRAALPASLARVATIAQPAGDLGRRMIRVAAAALARAPRVAIVGSDLPGLPAGHIEAALASLDHSDAVLGPASDGGFYLLGLRRADADLLDGLPWSRADTRAATRARLAARGYAVAEAPPFDDVDDAGDLQRLRRALAAGTVDAPATRRALERLSW